LRAKEIGIRKVSGAVKTSLVGQFLAESVLVAMLSGILSLCIAELLLPGINLVTQKHLVLLGHPNILLLATVLIFSMVIGLAAGLYPAFYLSSFQPVKVLKGTALGINARFSLRKVLVVIQLISSRWQE
jgi:ABC-type antimicrobial peptide transport system permease subunit